MNFHYTRDRFYNDLNAGIQNRADMLIDINRTINTAVTEVMTDFPFRTAKRRAPLSTGIYDEVDEYMAPDDLDAEYIIDIVADNNKRADREWSLTTTENMRNNPHNGRSMYQNDSLVAVDEYNGEKRLLINSLDTLENKTVLSTLDGVDENGTNWTAVGDGENVRVDSFSYKKGSGSLAFDVDNSGTSDAGIKNSGLASVELTDDNFSDNASIFTYAYLPSSDKVNGFTLRIGSSELDYYEITTNARHDKLEFATGWNLIRFDVTEKTETGTVDDTDITYVELQVNKETSLVNTDGFKFDHVVLRTGETHDIYYYTKYPWVDTDGVYKQDSTTNTDRLVAEADEYNLFLLKALQKAFLEAQEDQRAQNKRKEYNQKMELYKMKNTSNAMMKSEIYHDFSNPSDNNRSRII